MRVKIIETGKIVTLGDASANEQIAAGLAQPVKERKTAAKKTTPRKSAAKAQTKEADAQ